MFDVINSDVFLQLSGGSQRILQPSKVIESQQRLVTVQTGETVFCQEGDCPEPK